jgi:hypothetical protein
MEHPTVAPTQRSHESRRAIKVPSPRASGPTEAEKSAKNESGPTIGDRWFYSNWIVIGLMGFSLWMPLVIEHNLYTYGIWMNMDAYGP